MFNKTLLAICATAICLNANAFTGLSDAIAIAEAEGGSAYMVKRGERQNKDVFNVFIKTKQGTQLVSIDAASGEVLSQESGKRNSAKISLQQAIAAVEKDGTAVEEAVLVGELPHRHGQKIAVEPFYLITANINGNRERIFISAEDGSRLQKPKMLEHGAHHQANSHAMGAGGHCEHHEKQAGKDKVEASAAVHQHHHGADMHSAMQHNHAEMAAGHSHNHGNMTNNHAEMAAGHSHNHGEMMRNRSRENIDATRQQNSPPREMTVEHKHQHRAENKSDTRGQAGGHCEHHGKQAEGGKMEASAVGHHHHGAENQENTPAQPMQHNHQH